MSRSRWTVGARFVRSQRVSPPGPASRGVTSPLPSLPRQQPKAVEPPPSATKEEQREWARKIFDGMFLPSRQ